MAAWFPVCFTHSALLSLCIQSTSERWSIGPLCLRCPIVSRKTIFTHFLKFELMKYVMWKSISLELLNIYSFSWSLVLFLILTVRPNPITNYKRNLRLLAIALIELLTWLYENVLDVFILSLNVREKNTQKRENNNIAHMSLWCYCKNMELKYLYLKILMQE